MDEPDLLSESPQTYLNLFTFDHTCTCKAVLSQVQDDYTYDVIAYFSALIPAPMKGQLL